MLLSFDLDRRQFLCLDRVLDHLMRAMANEDFSGGCHFLEDVGFVVTSFISATMNSAATRAEPALPF